MMAYQFFTVSRVGPVARVDLNRPRHANCLNGAMWDELQAVFDALDAADHVRAVVLGGKGRHFCAGIDLEYLASMHQKIKQIPEARRLADVHRFIAGLQTSVNAIERCRKPVLAAIQGACIGGGLDIAAACDMRYATAQTRFSVKEVDLAIVADLGILQRLPGIVGQGVARELAYTGREFKGEEALTVGFVNGLYPTQIELTQGAMARAELLAAKSPQALRGIKATLNFSRDYSVDEGLDFVARQNAAVMLSGDLEEAVDAHMEKRQAIFDD